METGENCRDRRIGTPVHLPPAQAHETRTQAGDFLSVCLCDPPGKDAGHARDKEALENGQPGLLLPLLHLVAGGLEELEVALDPPAEVVPARDLCGGESRRDIREEEPTAPGCPRPVRGCG